MTKISKQIITNGKSDKMLTNKEALPSHDSLSKQQERDFVSLEAKKTREQVALRNKLISPNITDAEKNSLF